MPKASHTIQQPHAVTTSRLAWNGHYSQSTTLNRRQESTKEHFLEYFKHFREKGFFKDLYEVYSKKSKETPNKKTKGKEMAFG